MKKILISLLSIVAVLGAASAATYAYFSDTEVSTGNTFTTGTIDIAVNDENPWTYEGYYKLEDMKPSQTDYVDFVVHNVGSNPVNLWKKIDLTGWDNGDYQDGTVSEPECLAENGVWTNPDGPCTRADGASDIIMDLENVINYDLVVELYDEDPESNPNAEPVWWENIYTDGMSHDIKLGVVSIEPMYLGMVPAGKWMKVYQSYHMVPETGNEYQGDILTFDITLIANQLGVDALRLDNKEEVGGESYTRVILDFSH